MIVFSSVPSYERFVPRELLHYMRKGSLEELRLDDHVRLDMSVLFSDIRSFTTLSEQLTPEQNFRFLNSYLSKMEPSVERHGGFIDKFIGDSIMALFGGSNHADDAVRSALHMFETLRDYNLGRLRAGYAPVRIGIGLNSGPLLLGVVGGERRLQGTVIGDAVNVASRIEDLNKIYGTALLATGNTLDRLADPSAYAVRRIDEVRLRGRTRPERIYELFDADAPEIFEKKLATLPRFEEAVAAYEAGDYLSAKAAFLDVYRRNRFDLVAREYLRRCERPGPSGEPSAVPETDPIRAAERNENRLDAMLLGDRTRTNAPVPGSAPASSMLEGLAEAAEHYFRFHLGWEGMTIDDDSHAPDEPAPLSDVTAVVFLDGAMEGGFALTADVDFALRLLHRMSYAGWSAEEEIPLLLDAMGEAINLIAGNGLRMFQQFSDFVTIEPPLVRRTAGRTLSVGGDVRCRAYRYGSAAMRLIAF